MPATEALQSRFQAAHTQVLGVSVDSVHCHANWGVSLGGVSFPLLADFHPKGAVAKSYGLYLAEHGITDRATVIIDAGGTVRYAASVGPGGKRDIAVLAAECEKIDAAYDGKLDDVTGPEGLSGEAALYVKSRCGFSLRALNARANLHLEDAIRVYNVTEDKVAAGALEKLTGKNQVPCLVIGGTPILESDDIVTALADAATNL